MRYLSLCSGIEAASVAWQPLGWEPVAFAEHEPGSSDGGFAAALLAHRFPDVVNLGPLERITSKRLAALGPIDVIIGGTPCQDLSVAGKRAGLSGARSSLFHHYARIVHAARRVCGTRWALWENVPGAFSSNQGRDFARVVGALAGCEVTAPVERWGSEGVVLGDAGLVEWAVLDTQWFGLAQRRDRVFVIADFGDWNARAPVLLEPESVRGDHPPRRETGARVTGTFGARTLGRGSSCGGDGRESFLVPGSAVDVAGALTSHHLRGVPEAKAGQLVAGPLLSNSHGAGWRTGAEEAAGNHLVSVYAPEVAEPITLQTGGGRYCNAGNNPKPRNLVACFDETQITHPDNRSTATPETAHVAASARPPTVVFSMRGREGGSMPEMEPDDVAPALRGPGGGSSLPFVLPDVAVRRLTPRECERLFGFPDDWTLIPYRGKPAKDTPRYAALGNSIGIPPLEWIGRRIAAV